MPKILVKIGTFQGKNVQVKVLRFYCCCCCCCCCFVLFYFIYL